LYFGISLAVHGFARLNGATFKSQSGTRTRLIAFIPLSENLADYFWIAFAISVVLFVGSLILFPILLVRLPADYFVRRPMKDWTSRHPLVHIGIVVAKNLLGAMLLVVGVVMLVLPGQGLLTILMGIVLLDFPGKRKLERRLIQYQPLGTSANWLRKKYGKPPFEI
jgi:Putative transmembrane protein (PGPGW)